eukprot:TRINITY_DN75324_c0_g1_i1.p1 TRINITY_DN75324_c0_g1~~TRINITY_DN75324_c0_g1_i1.p1  ORF type:complete len:526 (+),score=110.93 TRINITY_DN75324_c0_g1_i1:182-1759(+)
MRRSRDCLAQPGICRLLLATAAVLPVASAINLRARAGDSNATVVAESKAWGAAAKPPAKQPGGPPKAVGMNAQWPPIQQNGPVSPPGMQGAGGGDAMPPPPQMIPSPIGKPQLFFLFLVYVKINNEEIWNRFFSAAVHGVDFRAFVHCKSEASCRENIKGQHFYEIIPSVETAYCSNLVGGMNALVRAAISKTAALGTAHAMDKFIFISDSTLPVKNFHYMQRQLTVADQSNFCVFPRNEWAEITDHSSGGAAQTKTAVKHHQWLILSRKHAQMVNDRTDWNLDIMQRFQLNQGFRNLGCLDEFWYFATIYKTFELSGSPEKFALEGFGGGGGLWTTSHEIQGQCDTFVNWHPEASGTNNNITRLAQSLSMDPGTELTQHTTWTGRPASIKRFSQSALAEMRRSPFLFIRKVDDGAAFSGCGSLTDAFDGMILAEPPRAVQPVGPWRGQGTWLDNQGSPVSITSIDGSLRLAGQDASMNARGSYCGDGIEAIWTNGFHAVATLSVDGMRLRWNNGVAWEKAAARL